MTTETKAPDAPREYPSLTRKTKIEGKKWKRLVKANLGNGFATYALMRGGWYSVNTYGPVVQDERWPASQKERDQIVAILSQRLRDGRPLSDE